MECILNAPEIISRKKNISSILRETLKSRVVDPYSFFPDPDPEFDVGNQYGSGSGSNTDPGL
jgi:hypothetical protein